jgi:hypothetical protein
MHPRKMVEWGRNASILDLSGGWYSYLSCDYRIADVINRTKYLIPVEIIVENGMMIFPSSSDWMNL